MVPRKLFFRLQELLSRYPAVALLGPRQAGKTTFAKSLAGQYFDLELPQDQLRLNIEWEELSEHSKGLLVLDEAQEMPEIFPRLRAAIDRNRRENGRFLLLGSISPALMTQVSQSLTGRLAICELSPFNVQEIDRQQADDLWKAGGYPDGGILSPDQFPGWQVNYLQLMAQRDLPNWGLSAKPATTERLFRMLATVHAQTWNASQLGKSLALNYHTVNSYVDFLENSYLLRRLPSYSTNLKKRLVKSPKIYWRDSGLLHALAGFDGKSDIFSNPWVGVSWEGWIIEQLLSSLSNAGKNFQAFYLRTSDQNEIDLLLEYASELWAFEIKLTSVPNPHDMERLRKTAGLVDADRIILLSRTNSPLRGKKEFSLNLFDTLELLLAPFPHPAA